MPTYTLRPSTYFGGSQYSGWSGVTSNAQLTSYIGDNSDTTFAYRQGSPNLSTSKPIFTLTAPTIGSGEFVVRAGHFVRWKGGDVSGEYLGAVTFRSTDATPSTSQSFLTDGRATITTTEVGYSFVNWSVADCANLRTMVVSSRNNPTPSMYLYEAGSTLYTLSVPSITLSNQTFTTTATPNIAVGISITQGWEASEADASNMKRSVTEVRVESGGTGVGTGTLIGYGYTDVYVQTTGTVNVRIANALPNGTYNLYARTSRFRDAQSVDQAIASTDQSSGWSSATLTMNNPAPTAPTVTPSVDSANKKIDVSVSASATSGVYAPSTIELQRSIDGGSTWSSVRTSPVSPRQNLINNPSFETNTTGWTASGGTSPSLSRSTSFAQSGTASASVQATAASGTITLSSTSGTNGSLVSPNLPYTASVYVRSGTTSRTGQVSITWYTSAGATISTSAGVATALTSGSFTRISVTATAPSNASYAQVVIAIATANIGELYYVDSILLEQASTAGTYLDFIATTTISDYEMPRGVSTLYRARVTAYSVGYPTVSAYTTSTGYTLPLTSDWAIKCPTTPALNMVAVQVVDQPSEELTEDLGVFRPLDRRLPVVVAGQLGGYDGELQIVTTSSSEWTSLKALLESQKVLYLESAFGWSKYIRLISGAKIEILGTQTAPRRRITCSYVEVSAP